MGIEIVCKNHNEELSIEMRNNTLIVYSCERCLEELEDKIIGLEDEIAELKNKLEDRETYL